MYWVRTFRDSYINLGQVKEMRVIRDADTGKYIIMADDTALEAALEHDLRFAAKFKKTCGFDDEHGLFYSRYSFLTHAILALS